MVILPKVKKRGLKEQRLELLYCTEMFLPCAQSSLLYTHKKQKNYIFWGFPSIKNYLPEKIPLIHSILLRIFFPFHLLPHPVLPFSATSPVPSRNLSFDGPLQQLHFVLSSPPPSHLPDCKTIFYYYNFMSGLLWHSLLNHSYNFTVFNR